MELPDRTIEALIETTILNHPRDRDCIFRVDSVQFCIDYIREKEKQFAETYKGKEFYITELISALKQCIVYCPHEGIDRRDEFPTER